MPGHVIHATPIAVDFWKPTKAPEVRLFFLTHLHSDHIEGLTSSWRLPIYTSPITALLLKRKFKLPNSIVHELEIGHSYLLPLAEGSSSTTFSVTVLEANHVPGAAMFLFQGYFGNILYCGDMRWDPEMLEDSVLRNVVEARELDLLYLDNTYSAPYCKFPSREEAKQQIFKIIDMYPDHEIKIGINTLGKEKLLEDIANRFCERILVSQDKYEQLQLLGYLDVFTTDPEQSRIHAVSLRQMQVASHKRWNEKYQTISIIPSALFSGWKNGPYSSQASNGIFVIPYSDHSSYSELMEMVSQLAPHQILPIVKYWSKSGYWRDSSAPDQSIKADMTVYKDLLSLPPPVPVVIPDDVIKIMHRDSPILLQAQPRRCVLRQGLSPRRSKVRGVKFTSPRSHSLPSFTNTPSASPISFATVESSRFDSYSPRKADNESPRSSKHGIRYISHSAISNTKHFTETATNEIHSGHVPSEMDLKRNTPTHLPDLHRNTRTVNEKNQSTSNASYTRTSVSRTNTASSKKTKSVESVKRALIMESPEKDQYSEEKMNLKRKKKQHLYLSMRRDALLKKTTDFITFKNKEMSFSSTCTKDELKSILKDGQSILESLSLIESLI